MATDTTKITGAADDLSDKLTRGGSAAKTLGAEIANAIKSLDGRVAALEAGGTTPPVEPPVTPPTSSAMTDCTTQNTKGKSEAFPAGVPHSTSWYGGKSEVQGTNPPSGYTAVTGWGQIYCEEGQSTVAGKAMIQKFQTWVVTKSGVWTKVQDQTAPYQQISGAHWKVDYAGNESMTWEQTNNSDGSVTVNAPPQGWNDHYWPGARGTFTANTVAGVFTIAETKVASSSMRFIVNIGADWWPSVSGGLPPGQDYNPGVGMCNWIKLTTSWRRSYFYSMSDSAFQANLPPPMRV